MIDDCLLPIGLALGDVSSESRIYRIARILGFRVFNISGIGLGFTQFAHNFNKSANYPNHITEEKTHF